MPIYEYRCQSCDKVLEVLVRTGKEPETCGERCLSKEHPEAGLGELNRKISRAGIIFKGSGFYVTDSRGGGGGTSNGSSGKSESGGGEGGATKTESSSQSSSSTTSSPSSGDGGSSSSSASDS